MNASALTSLLLLAACPLGMAAMAGVPALLHRTRTRRELPSAGLAVPPEEGRR